MRTRGVQDNTIVIFTSDNGGYVGIDRKGGQTVPATNNAPLRSGKGSLYEGGIRVPLIVRWPGLTPRGAECAEPVSLADLFPTLTRDFAPAARPGATPASSDDVPLDGVDLASVLKNPATRLNRDALFFHFPHYHANTTPVGAVRAGDWKLIEFFEDNRAELYNLHTDPREQTDLAAGESARVAILQTQLARWRREVGAEFPRPNPVFRK